MKENCLISCLVLQDIIKPIFNCAKLIPLIVTTVENLFGVLRVQYFCQVILVEENVFK